MTQIYITVTYEELDVLYALVMMSEVDESLVQKIRYWYMRPRHDEAAYTNAPNTKSKQPVTVPVKRNES